MIEALLSGQWREWLWCPVPAGLPRSAQSTEPVGVAQHIQPCNSGALALRFILKSVKTWTYLGSQRTNNHIFNLKIHLWDLQKHRQKKTHSLKQATFICSEKHSFFKIKVYFFQSSLKVAASRLFFKDRNFLQWNIPFGSLGIFGGEYIGENVLQEYFMSKLSIPSNHAVDNVLSNQLLLLWGKLLGVVCWVSVRSSSKFLCLAPFLNKENIY